MTDMTIKRTGLTGKSRFAVIVWAMVLSLAFPAPMVTGQANGGGRLPLLGCAGDQPRTRGYNLRMPTRLVLRLPRRFFPPGPPGPRPSVGNGSGPRLRRRVHPCRYGYFPSGRRPRRSHRPRRILRCPGNASPKRRHSVRGRAVLVSRLPGRHLPPRPDNNHPPNNHRPDQGLPHRLHPRGPSRLYAQRPTIPKRQNQTPTQSITHQNSLRGPRIRFPR